MAMAAISKGESTWIEDVKSQILDRLDADDFVSVERLAALVSKVQGLIKDGHALWSCTVCKRGFKRRSALREHIRYRHAEIKCRVCGRVFKTKSGLSAHQRTDMNRKPHGVANT